MIPMMHNEAQALPTAAPFSFLDTWGTRSTCLNVGLSRVTTAANCVEFDAGPFDCTPKLVITTWI